MTLQKVYLLGPVAAGCRVVVDEWGGGRAFLVATRRDDTPAVVVDRHRVRDVHSTETLALGTEVFIEGQVVQRRSAPHLVLARAVMTLSLPDRVDRASPGSGTHRSPTPHLRNGHWRRVRPGRPNERLVWVRDALVCAMPTR